MDYGMGMEQYVSGNRRTKMPQYDTVFIDDNKLMSIGFNVTEIQNMHYIQNNMGKFTSQALQSYGYTYEQAKRLMYAYGVCSGKIVIDSKEDMIKHLRKMFGTNYRISMQDLAVSKVTSIPRLAVVGNIKEEPYSIWNSKNYNGKDALYKVVDVTTQRITIETMRKPRLKYGEAKKIQGVFEIKGVKSSGEAVVSFDRKYCNLCNRFAVMASLRNPEFHLGKYEIVCFEGTKVYVFATDIGVKENIRYSGGTQRVYQYGIFPKDIKPKLDTVAKELYRSLGGVSATLQEPTATYSVITKVKEEVITEDDGVVF